MNKITNDRDEAILRIKEKTENFSKNSEDVVKAINAFKTGDLDLDEVTTILALILLIHL